MAALPTNFRFRSEKFRFHELVYLTESQKLCQRILGLVHQLLKSPIFNLGLSHIIILDRQDFKDRSNEGKVWMGDHWKDLGNTCYATLWQLSLHLVKQPGNDPDRKANIEAVIDKYPSLGDKWPQTELSLVLKGDVIEYVLWCRRLASTDMAPDYVVDVTQLGTLLLEWHACWKKLLEILAGHWDEQLSDSKLPTCRNLAQLIALSAVAERLQTSNKSDNLDSAFKHYTRAEA